jgi:hypothetical protein
VRIVAGLSVPEVGDVVTVEQDGYSTTGVVAGWYPNQQQAKVVFNNNPNHWLMVQVTLLGQGSVHERHRVDDMETARAAADISPEALAEGQRRVLFALADAGPNGLIDHEHERINGLIPTSARKRRLELRRKGLVESAGRRRPTGTGSAVAEVWCLTQAGYETVQSMRRRGVA